jgi:hypothetical protein
MRRPVLLVVGATLAVAGGCGGDDDSTDSGSVPLSAAADDETAPIDPGDGGNYSVDIDPAQFSSVVDNPYFPMLPGTSWRYEETTSDGEQQTISVEVTHERREVMGVDTIVVHDVVSDADGEVVEDTFDWFAQDADGNVWYFGEDSTSYDDGTPSKEGSWEAGVDGALPGIVMPARPAVSSTGYRQEYFVGEAEDMAQVIADSGSVTVPFGSFDDVIRTRDWNPLEPDIVEEKTYARSVGVVHEETVSSPEGHEEVVLVAFTPPG